MSLKFFVNFLKLLLELGDVFPCVGVQSLQLELGFDQRFLLIAVPTLLAGLQLGLGLDDVELLAKLLQLPVVDLKKVTGQDGVS